ncbi:thioesterase family protein [Salinisphaera aquimarina]|uniref:Thioesterase family protein n=1 Tax=Salinisphaera aquimarina TaxID=2094031 RepID=A0ABV7EUQ1_9GAMM
MSSANPHSVFLRDGDTFLATGLSRGPWDENAQHGGAPAALLAHLAETAVGEEFFLARLTFELSRPVPVAALTVAVETSRGRTARRVTLRIEHEGSVVGRAIALMLREQSTAVPATSAARLEPEPADCTERFDTPGMPTGESFHHEAMDIRVAHGSTRVPGPAAAWFCLRVPLIDGVETTPAMRAAAAADFGNGISWVLPFDEFLFTNTDLTLYLHRAPVGEWIGLDAETIVQPNGVGLASSTLYDSQGRIGMAHQNLLVRPR